MFKFIGRHLKLLPVAIPMLLLMGLPVLAELRANGVIDRQTEAIVGKTFIGVSLSVLGCGTLVATALAVLMVFVRHKLKTCPCPRCKQWRIDEGYEEGPPDDQVADHPSRLDRYKPSAN